MIDDDLYRQIGALQPELLRYARYQLRSSSHAEDVASETIVAALEGIGGFRGRSALRSWVFSILRHKIIDCIRANRRELLLSDLAGGAPRDDEADIDALLFDERGEHRHQVSPWPSPDDLMQRKEFFGVLEACIENLPPRTGRVFLMREWLELETEEICATLQISSNNLFVILHRARLRLRECLQARWLDASPAATRGTAR